MIVSSWIERKEYTYTTSCEEQTLQSRELGRGNAKQSSCPVANSPGSGLVLGQSIRGKKDESGSWDVRLVLSHLPGKLPPTGVNNTGSGGEDACRGSVADRLVDSPEFARWEGGGNWATCVNQYRHLH
jgi:hypothetical protein